MDLSVISLSNCNYFCSCGMVDMAEYAMILPFSLSIKRSDVIVQTYDANVCFTTCTLARPPSWRTCICLLLFSKAPQFLTVIFSVNWNLNSGKLFSPIDSTCNNSVFCRCWSKTTPYVIILTQTLPVADSFLSCHANRLLTSSFKPQRIIKFANIIIPSEKYMVPRTKYWQLSLVYRASSWKDHFKSGINASSFIFLQ